MEDDLRLPFLDVSILFGYGHYMLKASIQANNNDDFFNHFQKVFMRDTPRKRFEVSNLKQTLTVYCLEASSRMIDSIPLLMLLYCF